MAAEEQSYDEPFRRIQVEEAKALIDGGQVTVIDVREPGEYARDHIRGASLVPLGKIISNPAGSVTTDNVVFVCEVGQRSAVAAELAASLGMNNLYNLEGGMTAWRQRGYEVER